MKFKLILTVALVAILSSCAKETKQAEQAAPVKPKVQVATVNEREVEQAQNFTASVEPEVKNNIAPSTPGRIRQIFVEVGDQVRKGQKLAQMDALNLANSETQINNLRLTYQRVSELFSVGGASQQELDNAKLQLKLAETNIKNLNENTSLLSPISGIVTARNYDTGDIYTAQLPVLTVMQISPVKLKVNVSESYYTKIKTGMPVEVKVDVYENEVFKAKVSLVHPIIDERTRTFGVEIKLQNKDTKVRPGMFARVKIRFDSTTHVVVPDMAVIKQAGSAQRYVYVYADGKVSYRKIEIGQRLDNKYEILSGMEDGEQVVITGHSKLNDNTEVDVIK